MKARRLKFMSEAFAAEKAARLKEMKKEIADQLIIQEMKLEDYKKLKRARMMGEALEEEKVDKIRP